MTLIQNLPLIIDAGIKLIIGLVTGIVNALPILIQAAPQLINSLVTGILEAIPTLLEAATQLIPVVIQGIVTCLPMLIEAAVQIIMALINALLTNLPLIIGATITLMDALNQGLKDGAIAIWPKLKQVGADIVASLKKGFTDAWANFLQSCKNLIAGLPQWVKDILGIGSPSKVFMDIGAQMAIGLGLGWKNNLEKLGLDIPSFRAKLIPANVPPTREAGDGTMSLPSIIQNFYGPADREAVKQGTYNGILDALRAVGQI
jgi:phage-related protein